MSVCVWVRVWRVHEYVCYCSVLLGGLVFFCSFIVVAGWLVGRLAGVSLFLRFLWSRSFSNILRRLKNPSETETNKKKRNDEGPAEQTDGDHQKKAQAGSISVALTFIIPFLSYYWCCCCWWFCCCPLFQLLLLLMVTRPFFLSYKNFSTS